MNKHDWSIALCLAAVLSAASVSAQTSAAPDLSQTQHLPPPLREALKGIPSANVACRKEDFTGKPGEAAQRANRKADTSCAITFEQLAAFLDKPETVLVDTRDKAAFDAMHIDGAVNFNGSEIRTKRYLASKLVVLLGDGKREHDLYELCGELKAAGFKQTRVLRGGMLTWLLENKPVVGAAPDVADAGGLNPGELFQASKIPDNVIVGLSHTRKLADVLPMMVNLSGDSPAAIKEFIQKEKGKKTISVRTIVVVADERFDKGAVAELAKLAKPAPLLVYADSEAAYRQFLRVQNAMWAKQAKGPTKPRCGL